MAIIKLIKNTYTTDIALENLCAYIANPITNRGFCRGRNIDPARAYENICEAQTLWNMNGNRRAYHLIVSFAEGVPFDSYDAMEIARNIAALSFTNHQVLYSVHDKPKQLHLHFLINPVSLADGKKLQLSIPGLYNLGNNINRIINQYYSAYQAAKTHSNHA